MAKQPRKTRYSSSNCIQDIFGFICNYVLSYSKPDQKYIVEDYIDHLLIDEPQEIRSPIVDYVHTHTPVHIPDAPVEILVRHKPPALSPTLAKPLDGCKPLASSPVLAKSLDRYKPLDLPPILHDLPVNYINNLPRFDGENGKITAEKHIQNLEDFLDLYEVEDDDVCIRMFSLSLQGKVKNWFRNLPAASIRNFHQFMQVFLDRWVIMGNIFLILEEYDHLKRKPGETVQQFSTRFNEVYHSIPVDVRPPPGLAKLHFPEAFDPEMTFQLRERDTATLEEMKNIAVDVEANLLNRKAKLEAVRKDKTKKEHAISLEVKLDILTNTVNEMLHKINRKDEIVFQKPHVSSTLERTRINVPKNLASQPLYPKPPEDFFMYSIHNTVKEEVQSQVVVENSPEMICMFDDPPYIDNMLRYDLQYGDYMVEIEDDCSKQPVLSSWEEEAQLSQCTDDNQILHIQQDCKEDDAENFPRNAECLPLCFASLLREHYKQVVNRKNEENKVNTEANPEVQPLSLFEGQASDEIMKPKTDNELIHCDSLPLCFISFQIVRGNLGRILVENHSVNHEVPGGPIPPPSKTFYDPIADILDDVCFQSLASFTPNELKHCYDMDMFRQSTPLSGAAEASFQKPSEHPQSYKEVLKDTEGIGEKSSLDAELFEVENQKMGQTYIDPVNTYMEKFFNTGYFSIASVFPIVQVYQILCKEKQVGNYSQARVTDLFLSFITDSERTEPLDQLLDWLHWHFSIT
jgi:hypothetical protein